MICLACGTSFEGKRQGGRFCSAKCRAASWRMARDRKIAEAIDDLERSIRRLRQAVWREEEA